MRDAPILCILPRKMRVASLLGTAAHALGRGHKQVSLKPSYWRDDWCSLTCRGTNVTSQRVGVFVVYVCHPGFAFRPAPGRPGILGLALL